MSTLPVTSQARRTQAQITEVMRAIPSAGTQPEKLFRKALRTAGIRSFKVCQEDLPGKPDIVIPSRKLAIFIDGDFWHGNQYRTRGYASLDEQLDTVNNGAYWQQKIGANIARDLRNTDLLLQKGWDVARFWESEVRKNADFCVETLLNNRRHGSTDAFSALPQKTVTEFFSGIGLVRLALEFTGWKTILRMIMIRKKSSCTRLTLDLKVLIGAASMIYQAKTSPLVPWQPPHSLAMIFLSQEREEVYQESIQALFGGSYVF